MSAATAALIVVSVGATTYAMRAGLILLLAEGRLPVVVERALRNVAPAVMAALVVNLLAGGGSGAEIEAAEVAAVVSAMGVAWWRRSLVQALVVGMVVLWIVVAVT